MTTTVTHNISRDTITSALECGNLYEYEITTDYSGRGMNGDTCFGIIVTPSDLPKVYFGLGYVEGYSYAEWLNGDDDEREEPSTGSALMAHSRTDNMGRDVIVYFPRFQLAD